MSEIPAPLVNAATAMTRAALLKSLLDGSKRDIDQECGYPQDITIEQYRRMYEREGIAKRVVCCLPEESWAMDPKVYEEEDPELTEFEEAWEALLKKFNIFHYLHRVDELSGIGQFGVLLLGIDDGLDMKDFIANINNRGEKVGTEEHELIYLRAFDESAVTVAKRELDLTNPRYGLPVEYTINFQDTSITGFQAGESIGKTVHWTRIIHVADGRKMSEVFGTPRIQAVYNRIYDIRKVLSGSGEMYWKGAFPGYNFEVDPNLVEQGVEVDKDSIREELEDYANGLQRYLATTGLRVHSLSPQVEDPTGHVESQLKAIAISLSIPTRILFGSEQAQLASAQDTRTWNKRLSKRQDKYISPLIIRPFVNRLMMIGALPEIENVLIDWPDLNSPTDEDKARVASLRTTALAQYVAGGVDQLVPPVHFLTTIMEIGAKEVETILKDAEVYSDELEAEELERQEEAEEKQAAAIAAGLQPGQSDDGGQPRPFEPTGNVGPDKSAGKSREEEEHAGIHNPVSKEDLKRIKDSALFEPIENLVIQGGDGSGNFGHKGRPGKVGGSGGGGSGSSSGGGTVQKYLEMVGKVSGAPRKGWSYTNIPDLILKEGRDFESAPLPKDVKRGVMKECYMNTFNLVLHNPEKYIYVEGMAISKAVGFPLDHAFAVDRETGKVVDPTWTDGVEYRGVPLNWTYVRKTILAKETYGVLGDFTQEFPLLKGLLKEEWLEEVK